MLPSDPPVPTAAQFSLSAQTGWVDFDRDLAVGGLNAGNWTCRASNNRRSGLFALVSPAGPFNRVRITVWTPPFGEVGPDVISYRPPPYDVVSAASGQPANPFEDFPLTVVP